MASGWMDVDVGSTLPWTQGKVARRLDLSPAEGCRVVTVWMEIGEPTFPVCTRTESDLADGTVRLRAHADGVGALVADIDSRLNKGMSLDKVLMQVIDRYAFTPSFEGETDLLRSHMAVSGKIGHRYEPLEATERARLLGMPTGAMAHLDGGVLSHLSDFNERPIFAVHGVSEIPGFDRLEGEELIAAYVNSAEAGVAKWGHPVRVDELPLEALRRLLTKGWKLGIKHDDIDEGTVRKMADNIHRMGEKERQFVFGDMLVVTPPSAAKGSLPGGGGHGVDSLLGANQLLAVPR